MNNSTYVFEGSSFEIGQQHAAIVVEKYQQARQTLENSPYWQRLKNKSWLRRMLQKLQSYYLLRSLEKQLHSIQPATDYLNGMLSVPEITPSIYYFLLLSEILGADRTGVIQGCSGVGCLSGQSPLLGKNFDYQYPLVPYQGAIVRQEKSQYRYVAFAPILMPFGGQFCVNEHGLAVSYNYVYYCKGNHPGGLPASYLVHDLCRTCHSAEEAVSLAQQRNYSIGNGASLAVVDTQNFYIVEVIGNKTGVIKAEDSLLHTNHFLSDEIAQFNFPNSTRFSPRIPELEELPILESSHMRLSKLQERASQINSLETLQKTLAESTDENGMNNVFQTGPFWGTISSYIVNLAEMTIYEFKDVRTCQPTVYDIKALLSSSLQPICSQK
ncbi:MAG: C45 family autoproteolytic acyltransferase/hydrolase [Calothrix sp. MO_167.B12]|nr:C45 family autoproteolytic acyltransferase/hydrolase [Calothrix sp. MO_167.B12]